MLTISVARTNGSKRLGRGKARWEKKKGRSLPSVPPISSRRPARPRPRLDSEPRLARVSELEPKAPGVTSNSVAPALDFELTFEHDFFLAEPSVRSPELVDVEEEEEEDPEFRMLTAAEQERRLWFRRQVARFVAFLAAFALLAFLLRLRAAG